MGHCSLRLSTSNVSSGFAAELGPRSRAIVAAQNWETGIQSYRRGGLVIRRQSPKGAQNFRVVRSVGCQNSINHRLRDAGSIYHPRGYCSGS